MLMKLKLEAFSLRDLQNTKAILINAERESLSIKQVLNIIEDRVNSGYVPPTIQPKQKTIKAPPKAEKMTLCPECNNSIFYRIRVGNEWIKVCPKCRYSIYLGT